MGKIKVDISYGGMFFAICDAKKLGLDIYTCGADALAATSDRVIGMCFITSVNKARRPVAIVGTTI